MVEKRCILIICSLFLIKETDTIKPYSARNKMYSPTVLDLFCGAGGMSLGFQNAGCKLLGGIDSNPHAIRTHHRNFRYCRFKFDAQDISTIKDISKLGIKAEEVDILVGGPPCQVFSVVGLGKMKSLGKKVEKDARNFLYQDYIRFITYFKPLFFVIENVNTLKGHWIFPKIKEQLEYGLPGEEHLYPGYEVSEEILIASDYGVPQVRKRLFIVGKRKDTNLSFEFPNPTTEKPVSVDEAISDLPALISKCIPLRRKSSGIRQIDRYKYYKCLPQSKYQKLMRHKNPRQKTVKNHICRTHNEKDLYIFGIMPQGGKYKDLPDELKRYKDDIFEDKYRRLKADEPSWTLTAHMQKDCLAYIHPTQVRSISVREAARLQSFPDHFIFHAPMTRMFELVGNSVPPLLAEAIAKPIVEQVRKYKLDISVNIHL